MRILPGKLFHRTVNLACRFFSPAAGTALAGGKKIIENKKTDL
jgi:hypothetical protein